MSELKFDCPSCKQSIACDELWGGHQIQCPSCKNELTVPQKFDQAAPAPVPVASQASSLVPKVPAANPKLSIGRPQHEPTTNTGPPAPPPFSRRPPPPPPKKTSPVVKGAIAA